MDLPLPTDPAWYNDIGLVQFFGTLFAMALAGAVLYLMKGFLTEVFLGSRKMIEKLRADLAKFDERLSVAEKDISAAHNSIRVARAAEIDLRQDLNALTGVVNEHSERLTQGDLMHQEIRLYMKAQSENSSEIKTMVCELQKTVTSLMIQMAKEG